MTSARTRLTQLHRRLAADESGVTLVELLIVLVIIGILLAVSIPSYLGFKLRAERAASYASVRAGIPAAAGYYTDAGTFVGMTATVLRASYDRGIKLSGNGSLIVTSASASTYTMTSTVGGCTATFSAPGTTMTNSC